MEATTTPGPKAYPRDGDVETLEPEDEIQVRNVLAAIDTVVAEAGEDFTYQGRVEFGSCLYVRNGRADCLAGRVLAKLGMSLEDLVRWEGMPCDAMSANPLAPSKPQAPVGLYALATLRAAQVRQDRGESWSAARDAARRWAKDCYGIEV